MSTLTSSPSFIIFKFKYCRSIETNQIPKNNLNLILRLLNLITLIIVRSSVYHYPLIAMCCLCCTMWPWESQVHMDVPWMAWIRCAMEILGPQQRQLITKKVWDSHLGIVVCCISSAQMTIVITNVSIGREFAIVANGLDEFQSHFILEVQFPYKPKSRVGHSQKIIKPCEKECRVYFIYLWEIYTILRCNEGPLQLQSCVPKKNKGTI